MGSHSVTCLPTQVKAPRLTPVMQAGARFTYPGGMEGWVDLVDMIALWSGVELATFQSRVRRPSTPPPRKPAWKPTEDTLNIFCKCNYSIMYYISDANTYTCNVSLIPVCTCSVPMQWFMYSVLCVRHQYVHVWCTVCWMYVTSDQWSNKGGDYGRTTTTVERDNRTCWYGAVC